MTEALAVEALTLDIERELSSLGFEGFRPGQREAIEAVLQVGRVLLVAPTGGGKSLTYQLPAAVLPGTTLVVSPLVSLMHDQCAALDARGVPATFLAATLDGAELRRRMQAIVRGAYKIIYAAPERLAFSGFRGMLRDLECPLVAVDEAHCISEWGHDFRPEYLAIGDLLRDLNTARVLACTATATPVVRDEILERLGLDSDTPQILRGFARPNLALRAPEVRTRREGAGAVNQVLREVLTAPGSGRGAAIVYAPTRRITEEEATRLRQDGWRAEGYHAGLPGDRRQRVQTAFAKGEIEIVVATNAFGMGIDRADVRAVIHLAPPSSVEAYYQEVGRAGRDGEPAIGLLLTSPKDMPLRRHLIERGSDDGPTDPNVVRHKWNLFLELMRWTEGGSCRHDAILRYFGDEAETLHGCGRCDECVAMVVDEPVDDETVSITVRKALSAVARIHARLGLQAAAKLLAGKPDPRLDRMGLDRTKTFGALAEKDEAWVMRLLRRCVTAGWVDFTGGDRPVAVLTHAGRDVLHAKRPARLRLPSARDVAKAPSRARVRRPADVEALPSGDVALFDVLRRHRLELARAKGVPPYVIASDRALRDIAALKPRNIEELKHAHGIGDAKAEQYGVGFLAIVNDGQ